MRTLLVEDDPLMRAHMLRRLESLDLRVTAVADGGAGLVAHLKSPFELLVVDWITPETDGLQLCRRIRSTAGGDVPYILVVTARDRPGDLAEVLDAGADDYIAKPVGPELLETRVRIAQRRVIRERTHRAAQAALAQSEADFRRVIERSSVGVLAYRGGRIVYVNATALSMLAARSSDLVGAELLDLVCREDRRLAAELSSTFERTQVPPPPIDVGFRRAGGDPIVIRMIPATGAVYQGERACFVLMEDITEQRAAAQRLRMTQFAVDHAADAALWIRDDGRITYANRAATELTGYSDTALVGLHVLDLTHRFSTGQWGAVRRFLRMRGHTRRQMLMRRRDAGTIPVEFMVNVVDFDGERLWVAFARDVSERQRMQASLRQADRLASVGSLAAGVAHEINNPLAYIITNLEVLHEELVEREVPVQEIQRTLAEATEGAHRVRRIVRDLKSFARADQEEFELVSVHDVLDVAIDIASNEIRHRARLERNYSEIPSTWANGGRLTQVFLNLLVNAAHAIPEDGEDQVIAVRTSVNDGTILVEISDTGTGIAPEIVDRIFDPFFSTKPQGVGTGLGLSICHGIVTSMGGRIDVESQLGRGAVFRLYLPVAAREAPPRRRVLVPDELDHGRRLRILVVDDEPVLCSGIRRALSHHDVVVASSGADALHRCEVRDFDLVLCDLMMPGLSGMEVFARVRARKPGLGERFVFMTGGAFTPKARDFLDAVDNEHIAKPFSLQELRALVAKMSRPTS